MSKKESIQKRLQKVRPPRVQMTYDVEIGEAIEQKELPFVVGVVGEFSGQSSMPQPKLKDKKFVAIDNDNFIEVMKGLQPQANFQVENKINDQGGKISVELKFESIDDFRPEAVVQQVEALRKLQEARAKLHDLRSKVAVNEKLEDILHEVLNNTEKLAEIGQTPETSE